MSLFTGSGVAMVTPFDADGNINYDVFERLVEFNIANGTDAIIVCGTTGEAATLTDEEQIEAIKFVCSITKKRIPVIAGAGSNYTSHGIELCKESERVGADGLLIVTPYYNKTTQKGLVRYFSSIASSVDIPIIMYSVKSRTGLNIDPKTAYELSKIDNIVAIKEASGDLSQVAHIASLCGDSLDIYSGNDDQVLPVLSLGGKGVISVLANIAPQNVHDMTAKFFAGDVEGARKLQVEAIDLISSLFCEVNPIPVKAALNMMGFNVGGYREPLIQMEDKNLKCLEKSMKAYGLI